MIQTLLNISIKEILEYYALINLLLMPFCVAALVILSRKTTLIKRLDAYLDRLMGLDKPLESKTPSDKVAEQLNKDLDEADSPENYGISCFSILRGENYHCRLKSLVDEGRQINDIPVWTSDNEFIGETTPTGRFTASHAGKVKVFYYRKSDIQRISIQSYEIEVRPKTDPWELQGLFDSVFASRSRADILDQNLGRKIARDCESKNILEYGPEGTQKRLLYQFGKKDRLERAVLLFKGFKGKDINALAEQLDERMEEVRLKGRLSGDLRLWIYREVNEARNAVRMYCWLRHLPDEDVTVLALSGAWREQEDIDEFLLNLRMTYQTFIDCIPEYLPVGNYPIKGEVKKYKVCELEPDEESAPTQTVAPEATKRATTGTEPQKETELTEEYEEKETDEEAPFEPKKPMKPRNRKKKDTEQSPETDRDDQTEQSPSAEAIQKDDLPEIGSPEETENEENTSNEEKGAGELDFNNIDDVDENI